MKAIEEKGIDSRTSENIWTRNMDTPPSKCYNYISPHAVPQEGRRDLLLDAHHYNSYNISLPEQPPISQHKQQ